MSNKDHVLYQLDALGVPYACYEHPAAYTMEDCYRLPFVTPDLLFCKNLLLCNRQQTAFYLLVLSPERAFRTAELSHELGVPASALRRRRLCRLCWGWKGAPSAPWGCGLTGASGASAL
jgi:hypothetical protein